MTVSIDPATMTGDTEPPSDPAPSRPDRERQLVRVLWVVSATTTIGAAGCLAIACFESEWRFALTGSTLLVLAWITGATLCVHAMLKSRREFYRRGHLDGWMRGWRGEGPYNGDPLLR